MNYIQTNVTIPAYGNKGLETISAILPAETDDPSVRKVTIVRTSNQDRTQDKLEACCIELTRYQTICLIEILYKVTESPIIFYLDKISGQPTLEIYDDCRE